MLHTQILPRNFIPDIPTIPTDLHARREMPTTRVRPAFQGDLAVVYDLVHIQRAHDRTTDRHVLDADARRIRTVMFPNLRIIIQILFLLHRSITRALNDIDLVKPLAASRANISKHHGPQRETMDFREWLAIHLKCEEDLVDFHLSVRHGDGIVKHLPLFEIRVCAQKLNVILQRRIFQAATVLDDFLKGDTCPFCGSYGTLSPLCIYVND